MIRILRNFDYTLLIVPILLSAFGVVIVYSSSMVTAVFEGLGSTHYLIKQLQWFILSLVFFFIFSFIPYKYYPNHTKKIIGVCIVLLVLVIFFGIESNQAVRALSIFGFFNLHPTQFIYMSLIIYLAHIYSKKQSYINDFFKGEIGRASCREGV